MRGWEIEEEGSYTVEAALLVPIVLGIIFSLFYFLIYEHDKVVLTGNLNEQMVLFETGGVTAIPEEREWQKMMQKHLWMAEVTEGGVKKRADWIEGRVNARMRLSVPVMNWFLKEKQYINRRETRDLWHPEEVKRWRDVMPEQTTFPAEKWGD